MSSMKQIQDLQNQLAAARQELAIVKTVQEPVLGAVPPSAQESEMERLLQAVNMAHVRQNLHHYNWFRVPRAACRAQQRLPDQNAAWSALQTFLHQTNPWLPLFDKHSIAGAFRQQYVQSSFTPGAFSGTLWALVAHEQSSLKPHQDAIELAEAEENFRVYADRDPVEACKTAIVLCLTYMGQFCISQSSRWLAVAVRLAQEVGLHLGRMPDPATCRVWPCLYFLDRLIALEHSVPLLIDTSVCDARALSLSFVGLVEPSFVSTATLLAVQMEQVLSLMQLRSIDSQDMHTVDGELRSIVNGCKVSTDTAEWASLERMQVFILAQSCRLLLYRHNLSVFSTRERREAALGACATIAEETVAALHRHAVPSLSANFFQRSHLWRCILILLMARDFSAARALWSIVDGGDPRLAQGSHFLWFFATALLNKLRSRVDIHDDAEMLAYVTIDKQNARSGWVWTDIADTIAIGSSMDRELRWQDTSDVLRQLENVDAHDAQLTLTTSFSPRSQHTSGSQSSSVITPTTVMNRISIADLV